MSAPGAVARKGRAAPSIKGPATLRVEGLRGARDAREQQHQPKSETSHGSLPG